MDGPAKPAACTIEETYFGTWRRFVHPNGKPFAEFISHGRLLGLPLLHFTRGVCPDTGKRITACGVVAIGRVAVGLVAIGQASCGLVAIGQLAIGMLFGVGQAATGVLALGQAALGLLGGLGQLATGYVAVGQLACGWFVLGQVTFGMQVINVAG